MTKKTKFKLDITSEVDTTKSEPRKLLVSFSNEEKNIYPFRKISEIRMDDTKFWMSLFFISSSSSGLINWFDETSHKNYEENKKGTKNLVPYFNTHFVATDEEYSSSTIKLFLSTFDGQGEGFLGSASEYLKNEKKSRDTLKKLSDHKHSAHVLVESIQVGPNYADKIFRIIGHYEIKN